jgi:hypothetical protein
MLYKHPGQHKMHGDKFDYIVVDELEVDKALNDGWYKTTPEALKNSNVIEAKVIDDIPNDDEMPTREELEDMANELDISFDGRTADKTLSNKIAEKLAE